MSDPAAKDVGLSARSDNRSDPVGESAGVPSSADQKAEDSCTGSSAEKKRCSFRHPTLSNRCTKAEGHERDPDREKRGHAIDLGPNHPGVKTEEFLRAKGMAFRELWRSKIKRGLNGEETRQLYDLVQKFHATEDP